MVNKYQVLIADDESRERWGYGIATRFDANGEPYPYDGALLVEDPSFVEITESRDTGGLTEAEHRQRTLDLAGEQLGSPSLDAEPCLAVADNQFVETYPAFAALGVLEEELGKQTASSPEFEGAREQWVKCMADAGFAVEDVHNPAGDLDMRVNSLAAAGKLSVDDLAPLVSEELVMASTDWECRRDSLTAEYDRIRHLVESDFLERAPELLSDLRDEGP